ILLQTIAGPDPYDPHCGGRAVPDYLAALDAPSQPPVLGRLRGLFEALATPETTAFMDRVVEQLRQRGAVVTDVALPAAVAEGIAGHRTVMAVEAAVFHEARLRQHPDDYQPRIAALLEEGLACPGPEYARCKEHQQQLARLMSPCFEGVDA